MKERNRDHDEIIRYFLGMLVLYKKQTDEMLDLEKLAAKIKEATEEEYSAFYLKRCISQCLLECPYEALTDMFYIEILT